MKKLDLLLLNSPILGIGQDPDSTNNVPPLGLGYIYTQVRLKNLSCEFIDSVVENFLPEELIRIIDSSNARFVGINVFSSNLRLIKSIITKVECNTKFLLGGPAIKYLVQEIKTWNVKNPIIIICGEAELVVPDIIQFPDKWLIDGSSFFEVNVTQDSVYYPQNIDLPLDRRIFKNEPIHRSDLGIIESQIIASRGCIYNCGFCSAARSLNGHISPRYRSYESIINEIEQIIQNHPETNGIRVLDDLFLRDCKSVELAIKIFSRFSLTWRSMAHINTFKCLDSEFFGELKKSGCKELFFGIESGNNSTLNQIHKPFSSEIAFETIKKVVDSGISAKCYFILGFPEETQLKAEDTIELATKLKNYSKRNNNGKVRISAFRFRPYHGTELYNNLLAKGNMISPIANRTDIEESKSINPFDCVSGVYCDYNEETLQNFMKEIENLND